MGVVLTVVGECWEWNGARNDQGYGRKGQEYTHRLAWGWINGPIPEGMEVCHSCDNPPCCNPAHLFLGSRSDNTLDSSKKGRHNMARKTHCDHGHEFTAENTRLYQGRRYCRECKRRHTREYRARKRSVLPE